MSARGHDRVTAPAGAAIQVGAAEIGAAQVGAAVREAARRLGAAGVPAAEWDAMALMGHLLGCPTSGVPLRFARPLSAEESRSYAALVERRAAREPLQHLTERQEFMGLELEVGPGAMIPRPETELLVEVVLELLGRPVRGAPRRLGRSLRASGPVPAPPATGESLGLSDAPGDGGELLIADIGTGSGAIAAALAYHCPAARVVATDVSAAALALARRNLDRHGLAGRVRLLRGDLFGPLPPSVRGAFVAVVSNPPYIPSAEIASLMPEVRDHDPRPALDGGPDGLDFHRRLAAPARGWLGPGGWLAVEVGHGQAGAVQGIMAGAGYIKVAAFADYAGVPRVVAGEHRVDEDQADQG